MLPSEGVDARTGESKQPCSGAGQTHSRRTSWQLGRRQDIKVPLRGGRVNLKVECVLFPGQRTEGHQGAHFSFPGGSGVGTCQSIQKMSIQEPVCPSDGLAAPCAQDAVSSPVRLPWGFPTPLTLGTAHPVHAPAPRRSQQAAKGSDVNKTTQHLPSRAGNMSKPLQYPPGMTSGHSYAFPCCIRSRDVGHGGTVVLHKPAQHTAHRLLKALTIPQQHWKGSGKPINLSEGDRLSQRPLRREARGRTMPAVEQRSCEPRSGMAEG